MLFFLSTLSSFYLKKLAPLVSWPNLAAGDSLNMLRKRNEGISVLPWFYGVVMEKPSGDLAGIGENSSQVS